MWNVHVYWLFERHVLQTLIDILLGSYMFYMLPPSQSITKLIYSNFLDPQGTAYMKIPDFPIAQLRWAPGSLKMVHFGAHMG